MSLRVKKMDFLNRLFHGIWLASATLACTLYGGSPFLFFLSAISTMSYAEWLVLSAHKDLKPYQIFGLIVIASFQQSVYWMRKYNTSDLLKLFIIVWSTDTGAYICGKIIGGRKLLERVSPNKTFSGLLGGVYIGTCAGLFMKGTMVSSVLISIASQCGDLIESACKRIAGLKDSNLEGLAIPGHGGILDRIDALLFATPVAFFFSRL